MDSTRIMAVINRIRYGATKVPVCVFVYALLASGCASISDYYNFKRIANKFSYYYTSENTNIDSILNINGFFYNPERINSNENIMFFRDGLVVEGMSDGKRLKIGENQNIALLLKEIANNEDLDYLYNFYNVDWGSYILCGDTIKIQMINNYSWDTYGKTATVIWYKILDRNTIKKIYIDYYYFSNLPESQRDEYTYYPDELDIKPLTFKNACVPSTDKAFILKHKWFWKDESKWREFMQRVYPNEKIE